MKARQLLFILLLAIQSVTVGLFAATVTDNVTYSALGITNNLGYADDFSGVSITSDAEYAGSLEAISGEMYFEAEGSALASIVSGGYIKSVVIRWGATATIDEDEVTIYARNTPYDGSEVEGAGTKIVKKICSGSLDSYNFSTDYQYILIISQNSGYVDRIEIEWTTREDYTISTVDPGVYGALVSVPASSAAGNAVEFSITKKTGYAITGYRAYKTADPSVTVSEASHEPKTAKQTYSFTMPAYPITIEGRFTTAPTETLVPTITDASGNAFVDLTSMISGNVLTYNYSVASDYDGDITVESTNTTCAQVRLEKTNAYSGRLVISPYSTGTPEITLRFGSTGKYKAKTVNPKTSTPVSRRPVALIAQYNDKYFAVTSDLSGVKFVPLEVLSAGGNYYYDPSGSYDVSDLRWYVETIYNAYGNRYRIYTTLSGTTQVYADGNEFYLASDERLWKKDETYFYGLNDNRGLVYNNTTTRIEAQPYNSYESLANCSRSAFEVPIANIQTASEYTRSLTAGNFATMCLPYAVSQSETFFSGAEVYNITGKQMADAKIVGIEMEQETEMLVAGKPYVILATESTLSVMHGPGTAESPVAATGLVGNLNSTPIDVPVGCYGFSANKLRKVVYAGTAHTQQYKAYIDLSAVPVAGGSPAPGRRVVVVEDIADSIEIIDNTIGLNWNEPVYNMLGQQVGQGTTGVLIQNGQKFLVQ